MLPPKTIQDDLKDWVSSNHDSKTKWNKLKDAWSTYAGKRKLRNKDNAIYEVVLQVSHTLKRLKLKQIFRVFKWDLKIGNYPFYSTLGFGRD